MSIPPQVPPAPANPQPDGHRENVPQPLWGVAGPGIVQDPHLAAYQGVMDHHPQPLVGVSNSVRLLPSLL